MRAGIHPEYHEVEARCACGATWKTRSTRKELRLEICSNCHPFFTGRQKLVDTEGRVERFTKKYGQQTVAALKARQQQARKAVAKPAAARAEPPVAETERSAARTKPAAETKPAAADAKPAAEAKPAATAKRVATRTKPAATEAKPAAAEAEPAATDGKPAAETKPAADVTPADAEAETTADAGPPSDASGKPAT